MRADAQLDYAIFQLTPTRTRCELHIVAKGVTYKLASGLLKPFVSHLKAAEEQLAKGGYSLRLEPSDPSRASWFTKGTMERFVRFVSTPEVLERVTSVEVELLELEETARQQNSEINEGGGSGKVDIALKAIVSQTPPDAKPTGTSALDNGSKRLSDGVEIGSEESSKQRLLRALDARRIMLQKEQGMAFARALAAGFNLENMDDLVLFAECFGADRLRDACNKFVTLCKKRQEAGLGLEDLELMAADTVQADMLYMGAVGGNAIGLVWPHLQGNGQELPHIPGASYEGKQAACEDSVEKARDEVTQAGISSMPAGGDGESLPAAVKGHPVTGAWQGQPHNQYMPSVPPYAAMHPGMAGHFDPSFGFTGPIRPGQIGLPYPHYLGGSYMPSYVDGNGWQSLSPLPPQYWTGNQASDTLDVSHHQSSHEKSLSTSSRGKDAREPNMSDINEMQDNEEENANEVSSDLSGRPSRRSASRRRRSASPMKKVHVARNGGSKRSGMVVIRNINYIAPKAKQQDNQDDGYSENSDSCSDDSEDEEILESGVETLRTSIEDAVEAAEGKHRLTQDGKKKYPKKSKKKAASKYLGHLRDRKGDNVELDDDEPKKHENEQPEYVWVINRRESGADEISKAFPENGPFSGNEVRHQGSFDPASESVYTEKGDPIDGVRSLPDHAVLLSQTNGNRAVGSHLVDMFKQEQHVESKQVPIVDDSYVILGSGSSVVGKGNATLESDYDFTVNGGADPRVSKMLPDDSFIFLDRSEGREAPNKDWSVPLNLEAEMPVHERHEPAFETNNFEPDDLFMGPDRDQDAPWSSPLDYNMQVLAADFMDAGKQGDCNDVAEDVDNADMQQQEVEEKLTDSIPKIVSEDATTKATKEMVERRKSSGWGRTGRPNPMAEAQLRAEKLRLYKAGLQKSKQEREEEERKRIEDLRNQRQQRIASRSNSGGTTKFSPSKGGAQTPSSNANKSSPKVPVRVSPVSSSVSRERVKNGSRGISNSSDCTKPTQSSVTRSISSLAELHRELKKPSSVVRASTGSQVTSANVKIEGQMNANALGKLNGHAEDKSVGAKIVRTDDKIGRSNSGLAEERVGRRESGRIDEKIGRTGSGRNDGLSESGRMSEKALPISTRPTKRIAQNGSALHVKSPRSPTFESVTSKKTSTVRPERVDGLASQVKSLKGPSIDSKVIRKASTALVKPTAQKKTNFAPKATTVELHTKATQLPSSPKEDPQVGEYESPVNVFDSKNSSFIECQNSLLNGNGDKHDPPASVAVCPDNMSVVKASCDNGLSTPCPTVMLAEESNMVTSQTDSPLQAGSCGISGVRHVAVETSCPLVEELEAFGDHGSPPDDSTCAFAETDICTSEGHLTEEYSPPFAPPVEYPMSLSVDTSLVSPTTQQESAMESSPNEATSMRSRKKWGDSKAKGLKRLLLLGRKSGRSSAQNAVDVPSDGEEDELQSSNSKNISLKLYDDQDACTNQVAGSVPLQGDCGSSNSSNKGSRSIFSLSTFRGNKGSVKA